MQRILTSPSTSPHLLERLPLPIRGVIYDPLPSNGFTFSTNSPEIGVDGAQTYLHGPYDLFHSDLKPLWSDVSLPGGAIGRNDLSTISKLGANLVRVLEWDPQFNHDAFSEEASAQGLSLALPISNRLLACYLADCEGPRSPAAEIQRIVAEARKHACSVAMWVIGNQIDLAGFKDPSAETAREWLPALINAAKELLAAEAHANWPESLLPAISISVSSATHLSHRCPTLPGSFLCDAYESLWRHVPGLQSRLIIGVQSYADGSVLNKYFSAAEPGASWMDVNMEHQLRSHGLSHLAELPRVLLEVGDPPNMRPYFTRGQLRACFDSYNGAPLGCVWSAFSGHDQRDATARQVGGPHALFDGLGLYAVDGSRQPLAHASVDASVFAHVPPTLRLHGVPGLPQRTLEWPAQLRTRVHYSIKASEWPSFLSWRAWDSCQGCRSATGQTKIDRSAETFQVLGDWMRVASTQSDEGVTISTANSAEHWFNPPRSHTTDKPLEMEFYLYLDASKFGDDLWSLTQQHWSALWAFGHGEGDFGWPSSGEWDILEWLPRFDANGALGATSGFHNAVTGAYPPCCMKQDGVMYDLGLGHDEIAAHVGRKDGFLLPFASKFRTWGRAFEKTEGEPEQSHAKADRQMYNTVIHVYSRCTTSTFDIFAKRDADPTQPPGINAETTEATFRELEYAHVFKGYGDFGSNNDCSFADDFPGIKAQSNHGPWDGKLCTNWHQNMHFVWSLIRLKEGGWNSNNMDHRNLVFYLSDVRMRGGSHRGDAQPPIDQPHGRNVVTEQDETPCHWLSGGPRSCNSRLRSFYRQFSPQDYESIHREDGTYRYAVEPLVPRPLESEVRRAFDAAAATGAATAGPRACLPPLSSPPPPPPLLVPPPYAPPLPPPRPSLPSPKPPPPSPPPPPPSSSPSPAPRPISAPKPLSAKQSSHQHTPRPAAPLSANSTSSAPSLTPGAFQSRAVNIIGITFFSVIGLLTSVAVCIGCVVGCRQPSAKYIPTEKKGISALQPNGPKDGGFRRKHAAESLPTSEPGDVGDVESNTEMTAHSSSRRFNRRGTTGKHYRAFSQKQADQFSDRSRLLDPSYKPAKPENRGQKGSPAVACTDDDIERAVGSASCQPMTGALDSFSGELGSGRRIEKGRFAACTELRQEDTNDDLVVNGESDDSHPPAAGVLFVDTLVRLRNMPKQPQLEGQAAKIVTIKSAGMYPLYTVSLRTKKSNVVERSTLTVPWYSVEQVAEATICGLRTEAHLNGREALVLAFNLKHGRYRLRLNSARHSAKLDRDGSLGDDEECEAQQAEQFCLLRPKNVVLARGCVVTLVNVVNSLHGRVARILEYDRIVGKYALEMQRQGDEPKQIRHVELHQVRLLISYN